MGVLEGHYEELKKALLNAYPNPNSLIQMLKVRLNKNLYAISNRGSYDTDVFYLIWEADAQGWGMKLVNAARESRPGNDELLAFSQKFGLTSISASKNELERIIQENFSFEDVGQVRQMVAQWLQKLGEAELQVCRIEYPGGLKPEQGTGFLVGPDVLLTNYHVMEPVIPDPEGKILAKDWKVEAKDVVLRFDYKMLLDGTTLNTGTTYRLAQDWLIAYRPYSPVDLLVEPGDQLPASDELDFALVRVEGAPGNDTVGRMEEPEASQRGYIDVPEDDYDFPEDSALDILQHPEGAPLKLAQDPRSIIKVNPNDTRVRYRTNTLPGSSGSPCFNREMQLVALHHSGDPNYDELHKPTYNQGIPIKAIRQYLQGQGLSEELGQRR